MPHDCHGSHSHSDLPRSQGANSRLRLAFWVNLIFTLVEVVGGIYTGSLAILADAVHDLGDTISLAVAWFLQNQSDRGPSAQFSYGYQRLSLLSAFLAGAFLLAGSAFVALESLLRLFESSTKVPDAQGMLVFAAFGVLANTFAAWRLHQGHSQNEKILTWHMIEDVLGWIVVFFGAGLLYFFQWPWLDPALAFGVSVFIGWNAGRHLLQTTLLFLQQVPSTVDLQKLRMRLENLEDVYEIHDLHVWSLDGERHVISLHAVVADLAKAPGQVKDHIRQVLKEFGDFHVTIELEGPHEVCVVQCEVP